MPGLLSKSHNDELDFELFSNIVLKFTAILMVVLVLLAINVGQRLDGIISTYRFSGGSARPALWLAAYEMENAAHKIQVIFMSASYAEASTYVGPNHETLVRDETQTISGRLGGTLWQALSLMGGIAPGSIPIDGKQTPFIIPNYAKKRLIYEDKDKKTRQAPASDQLALGVLKLWSDIYSNPVYPTRAFAEYKNSRTRIYVETSVAGGQHNFIVGNSTFTAQRIKAGALDFLTSLSSTNTEIVYLGEYTLDRAHKTSTRLDFYDENGFVEAANSYRSFLFPGATERNSAKAEYDRYPTWDQLASEKKATWLKNASGDEKLARSRYENSLIQPALVDHKTAMLEDALKNDRKAEASALPFSLAYPDAWQAYVDFRLKQAPTPPDWFTKELLEPLGFDKRVMTVE